MAVGVAVGDGVGVGDGAGHATVLVALVAKARLDALPAASKASNETVYDVPHTNPVNV